jgi:diguanylate cyclase (GGDEF)-like protein
VRLLIADDDANYCAYVVTLGARIGFVVDVAEDGEAALACLSRVCYDVVVIDLQMPRLNGMDVIARIRSDEGMKSTYTLMLSGREDVHTKVLALDAGFDDFVTKSATEAELTATLLAAHRVAARQRTLDTTIRELYGLATRDELTSVFNRRFFMAEAERMLASGGSVSIVLFDLDSFKQVNDTYGHLAGDQVLRDVGALFQKNSRPEDLVARYGGDEFVMAVANLGSIEVERIASRLAADVRSLRWSSADQTFSIGVTTGLSSSRWIVGARLDELLELADRDLYRNKWLRSQPETLQTAYELERPAGLPATDRDPEPPRPEVR